MVDYDPTFDILANSACRTAERMTHEEAEFVISDEFQIFFYNVRYGDHSIPGALPPYVIRIDVSALKQKQYDDDDDDTKRNEELPSEPVYYRQVSKLGTYNASRSIPDGFFRTTQSTIMESSVEGIEYKFTLTLYVWDTRTYIPDDDYDHCRTKKSACRVM